MRIAARVCAQREEDTADIRRSREVVRFTLRHVNGGEMVGRKSGPRWMIIA